MKHLEPLQDATRINLLKMFLLVQVSCTSVVIATASEQYRAPDPQRFFTVSATRQDF